MTQNILAYISNLTIMALNEVQISVLQNVYKSSEFLRYMNDYYIELKEEWGADVAKHWNPESVYRAVTEPGYAFADEVGTMLDDVSYSTINDVLVDMTNGTLDMMILSKAAYNNCDWKSTP